MQQWEYETTFVMQSPIRIDTHPDVKELEPLLPRLFASTAPDGSMVRGLRNILNAWAAEGWELFERIPYRGIEYDVDYDEDDEEELVEHYIEGESWIFRRLVGNGVLGGPPVATRSRAVNRSGLKVIP